MQIVDNLGLDLSFAGDQSIGSLVSALAGIDLRLPVAAAVALALFWWVFRDRAYRGQTGRILTGTAIGAAVAFGWVVTTLAYRHSFDPV